MHKSSSKWTVIAASILAVALHAAPFLWVELHQETAPTAAAVPAVVHPTEDAVVEKGTEITTSGAAARSTCAD